MIQTHTYVILGVVGFYGAVRSRQLLLNADASDDFDWSALHALAMGLYAVCRFGGGNCRDLSFAMAASMAGYMAGLACDDLVKDYVVKAMPLDAS